MWWYQSSKTAKIIWVTLDGAMYMASLQADFSCEQCYKVTQMIFAVLEDWYHHIVLTHSCKLVSVFTYII